MFKFLIIMITNINCKINIISICAYFTIQSCFLTLLLWLYNSSPTSELPQFLKFPLSFSLPPSPLYPLISNDHVPILCFSKGWPKFWYMNANVWYLFHIYSFFRSCNIFPVRAKSLQKTQEILLCVSSISPTIETILFYSRYTAYSMWLMHKILLHSLRNDVISKIYFE